MSRLFDEMVQGTTATRAYMKGERKANKVNAARANRCSYLTIFAYGCNATGYTDCTTEVSDDEFRGFE